MCWSLNHQNIIEMTQGHISLSEAPGHLRESVSFLPSLAEVVVSPDVLIHLLKQLL
jgi:hypothetical protein